MRCSYRSQWNVFVSLTVIFFILAFALFFAGGFLYHNDRIAVNTHTENICEVMASSYYEARCRTGSRRARSTPCFVPVWTVTYSIVEDIRIDATIEQGGLWSTEAAQNRLDQRQIGMSYSCWTNINDPSTARWDEPNTFTSMMFLIFGGVATAVGLVGVFLSYRTRKNL